VTRRTFLTSTVGTTLFSFSADNAGAAQQRGDAERAAGDLYLWRQYTLRTGSGPRRLADYLQNAYIPALNRIGHKPIGVFEVTTGLPTPTVFVLTPSSPEALGAIEPRLERD